MSFALAKPGLYLDTSCLLKLFFFEPESERVAALVEGENRVVVSELGMLEGIVQIHARRTAGQLTRVGARQLESALERLLSTEPFELLPVGSESYSRARAQASRLRKRGVCRTLDRLHLGFMQVEKLRRLLTNDHRQASAARALGMSVVVPSRFRAAEKR